MGTQVEAEGERGRRSHHNSFYFLPLFTLLCILHATSMFVVKPVYNIIFNRCGLLLLLKVCTAVANILGFFNRVLQVQESINI